MKTENLKDLQNLNRDNLNNKNIPYFQILTTKLVSYQYVLGLTKTFLTTPGKNCFIKRL